MTERVAAILDGAGRSEASGFPFRFTHHELACEVYETDGPTAAQLSAIRRAVAKLVAEGRAERETEREWGRYSGAPRHERTSKYGERFTAFNPGGVLVRRVLTEADREVRAAVIRKLFGGDLEQAEAQAEALSRPTHRPEGVRRLDLAAGAARALARGLAATDPPETDAEQKASWRADFEQAAEAIAAMLKRLRT